MIFWEFWPNLSTVHEIFCQRCRQTYTHRTAQTGLLLAAAVKLKDTRNLRTTKVMRSNECSPAHKPTSNRRRRIPSTTHLLTAAKTALSTQVYPPSWLSVCVCVGLAGDCGVVWGRSVCHCVQDVSDRFTGDEGVKVSKWKVLNLCIKTHLSILGNQHSGAHRLGPITAGWERKIFQGGFKVTLINILMTCFSEQHVELKMRENGGLLVIMLKSQNEDFH